MSDATTSSGIGRHLVPRQAVVSRNPVDGMVPLLNDLDIDTGRHWTLVELGVARLPINDAIAVDRECLRRGRDEAVDDGSPRQWLDPAAVARLGHVHRSPMSTLGPVPSVATGGFACVNLSRRYSLNLQQPLLVKYPSNNHGQRGSMSTQEFMSYFPVGHRELSG